MDLKRKGIDIRSFFSSKKIQTEPAMENKLKQNEDDSTVFICAKCSVEIKIFDKSFHQAFDCPPKSKELKPNATVLQDGLVLFRNWLNVDQQQHTIDFCIKLGEGRVDSKYSFFKNKTPEEPYSPKEVLAEEKKTKAFCQVPFELFDKDVVQIFKNILAESRKLSPSIPEMIPPITLVNYYTDKGQLGWHRDRIGGISPEEQDLITSPIVSFSLGDRAKFAYKDKNQQEHEMILHSGDVVVFGGPSRMMFHTVKKVYANTVPQNVSMRHFAGRFNITFREGTYYV